MAFELFSIDAVPPKLIALVGSPENAGPISQDWIMLLSFPVLVKPPPNKIVPPLEPRDVVDEPNIVHLVIRLLTASAIKRIVLVFEFEDMVVFKSIRELSPSMVTLSAPFKSINGRPGVIAPETVFNPPDGRMVSEFHAPSNNTAPATGSVVLPLIVMFIKVPLCGLPFIAVNAADKVV